MNELNKEIMSKLNEAEESEKQREKTDMHERIAKCFRRKKVIKRSQNA